MELGKAINKSFDKVYVKNLKKAEKRLKFFKEAAQKINLKYTRINAIDGLSFVPDDYQINHRPELYPNPSNKYLFGNFATTMYILLDAMSSGYDSFVVCDDDTAFYDLDVPLLKKKFPERWDVIVLGSMHHKTLDRNVTDITFTRLIDFPISGCHCIAINKSAYWTFLQTYTSFDNHGRFGDVNIIDFTSNRDLHIYLIDQDLCYQERSQLIPYHIE